MKPRAPSSIPRSADVSSSTSRSAWKCRAGSGVGQRSLVAKLLRLIPRRAGHSRAPIPTELHPSAQGCAPRATPGHTSRHFPQPQRGCVAPVRTHGRNPVGVDFILHRSPRVASRTRRPWAKCRYPVGVNRMVHRDCPTPISCPILEAAHD